jgi:hypothetical protein
VSSPLTDDFTFEDMRDFNSPTESKAALIWVEASVVSRFP